jgi:CHAT domain-containing protein
VALKELQGSEASALHYQAHALMGKIQRVLGDSETAWTFLQKAVESRGLLRSNLRDEELKIPFLKNKLEMYEDLVEICLEKGRDATATEQALVYIEEAKSRTLSDLLLRSGSSLAPSGDGKSEMVRQILSLREELNWYYHRIDIEQLHAEEKSPDRVQKLQQQASLREAEFLRALGEMQATGEGATDFSENISLDGVRSSLPGNAALLEYFTIGDRVIACVVQGNSLEIAGVTLVSRVVELLRLLQSENSKFRLGAEYVREHNALLLATALSHLKDLYDELISPIRDKLNGTHLVIVPHGSLNYVPFHALYDGTSYLIDAFTISYAPSANIFSQCQNNPLQEVSRSLVFGVSDENNPELLDEMRDVASALPSASVFVNSEATLDRLKDWGPRSRFIHIATHGNFRQDNPLFSGIRLGDARLNLFDLYQLKLPAELVALTGCATEMASTASGDELLGLFRGMFYAGAGTLLLTLWNVPGRSTPEFMKAFYGNVSADLGKPVALRQAMLEIRGQYTHPYYWAPFFLVGKVD